MIALINYIQECLPKVDVDPDCKSEIESDIATINAQISSPNPKKSIIEECLSSIQTILESAGGAVAGQLIMELSKHIIG